MKMRKTICKLLAVFLILSLFVSSGVFTNAETSLLGDVTADGNVDIRDLVRSKKDLASNPVPVYNPVADFNSDGSITVNDLIMLRQVLLGQIEQIEIELCTITGSYKYASGTYTNDALVNTADNVTVKVGNFPATVDTTTRTYTVKVPVGTYDVTLSSNQFRNVMLSSVEANENKELSEATFTKLKYTPGSDFGYSNDVSVWDLKTISPVGLSASEGFVFTATMKPKYDQYFRGTIGITVNGNTFYIKPGFSTTNPTFASIWTKTTLDNSTTGGTKVATTNQAVTSTSDYCTLKIIYLEGKYYAILKVDNCDIVPQVIELNATNSGLSADCFATGDRTISLCSDKFTAYYSNVSYQLGNQAASNALNLATSPLS